MMGTVGKVSVAASVLDVDRRNSFKMVMDMGQVLVDLQKSIQLPGIYPLHGLLRPPYD